MSRPADAPTFTFWIGPERRGALERVKEAGVALDVSSELRKALDRALVVALRKVERLERKA
jgi:hypothetical protein